LTGRERPRDTGFVMERYSALVGKRVEAHYRTGDIHLSAVGVLVSDTGKTIFLEEHFSEGGKKKTIRVEIPYEYVLRILEAKNEPSASSSKPGASAASPKKHA
jgi:hypothetical protein